MHSPNFLARSRHAARRRRDGRDRRPAPGARRSVVRAWRRGRPPAVPGPAPHRRDRGRGRGTALRRRRRGRGGRPRGGPPAQLPARDPARDRPAGTGLRTARTPTPRTPPPGPRWTPWSRPGSCVRDAAATYTVYAAPAADGSGGTQVGIVGLASVAAVPGGRRPHPRAHPARQARGPSPPHRGGRRARRAGPAARGAGRRGGPGARRRHRPPARPRRRRGRWTAARSGCGSSAPGRATGRTSRALEAAFAAMPDLYVADGHHRSEAAALVWDGQGRPAGGPGEAPAGWFPALVIPADRACVLPYDRLVADLGGRTARGLLGALAAQLGRHRVGGAGAPGPPRRGRPVPAAAGLVPARRPAGRASRTTRRPSTGSTSRCCSARSSTRCSGSATRAPTRGSASSGAVPPAELAARSSTPAGTPARSRCTRRRRTTSWRSRAAAR